MGETLTPGDRPVRPQAKPNFEAQLESLPPDVRSVAESLALRDLESARRYVAQYLAGKGGERINPQRLRI